MPNFELPSSQIDAVEQHGCFGKLFVTKLDERKLPSTSHLRVKNWGPKHRVETFAGGNQVCEKFLSSSWGVGGGGGRMNSSYVRKGCSPCYHTHTWHSPIQALIPNRRPGPSPTVEHSP